MAAPVEGQTFDSFTQFKTFLNEYCHATASTFVVDDSKRIEAANRQISNASKHMVEDDDVHDENPAEPTSSPIAADDLQNSHR